MAEDPDLKKKKKAKSKSTALPVERLHRSGEKAPSAQKVKEPPKKQTTSDVDVYAQKMNERSRNAAQPGPPFVSPYAPKVQPYAQNMSDIRARSHHPEDVAVRPVANMDGYGMGEGYFVRAGAKPDPSSTRTWPMQTELAWAHPAGYDYYAQSPYYQKSMELQSLQAVAAHRQQILQQRAVEYLRKMAIFQAQQQQRHRRDTVQQINQPVPVPDQDPVEGIKRALYGLLNPPPPAPIAEFPRGYSEVNQDPNRASTDPKVINHP